MGTPRMLFSRKSRNDEIANAPDRVCGDVLISGHANNAGMAPTPENEHEVAEQEQQLHPALSRRIFLFGDRNRPIRLRGLSLHR